MDVAALTLRIDSSEVAAATHRLRAFASAAGTAATSQTTFAAAAAKTVAGLEAARAKADALTSSYAGMASAATAASAAAAALAAAAAQTSAAQVAAERATAQAARTQAALAAQQIADTKAVAQASISAAQVQAAQAAAQSKILAVQAAEAKAVALAASQAAAAQAAEAKMVAAAQAAEAKAAAQAAAQVSAAEAEQATAAKSAAAAQAASNAELRRAIAVLSPVTAAANRYAEAQDTVKRAVAAGQITQAQANDVLEDGALIYARTTKALNGGTIFALRNLSLQLNQVAQQGMITGNYIQAMAIQLPDMLLSFGLFGALAGVVIGALGPLALEFFKAKEQAETLEETLTNLSEATSAHREAIAASAKDVRELSLIYGSLADEMMSVNAAALEIRLNLRLTEANDTIEAVKLQFKDLLEINMTLEQLAAESYRLAQLPFGQDVPRAQRDALQDQVDTILDHIGALEALTTDYGIAENKVKDFADTAQRLAAAIDIRDKVLAINDLAVMLGDGNTEANKLAIQLLGVAAELAGVQGDVEGLAARLRLSGKTIHDELNDKLRETSGLTRELIRLFGLEVPAAIQKSGGSVDAIIASLKLQNAAMLYQYKEGLSSAAAEIKAMRDEALRLAAESGAHQDVLDGIYDTYTAAADEAQRLAEQNASLSGLLNGGASAANDLNGALAQAVGLSAQLLQILGGVPSALAAIGGQVDAAIGALKKQHASLTYQVTQGISAAAAEIKVLRDQAIRTGLDEGLSIDKVAEIGAAFDAQASKAEELAIANQALTTTLQDQGKAGKAAGGGSGAAADGIDELKKAIDRLELDASPILAYAKGIKELNELLAAGLSARAYTHAIDELNEKLVSSTPLVEGLSDTFSDFANSFFTNWRDMLSDLFNVFKQWLVDMATTAFRNKILVPIALGKPGGGLIGAASGFIGGIGKGFQASLGVGGFTSAGLFNVGANAATAAATGVGTFAATLGAAIPLIGAVTLGLSALIGKTTQLDAGIKVTVDSMGALVETFSTVQKSRLFGLLKSTSTTTGAASLTIADPVAAAVEEIQIGVLDAANVLNIAAATFEGFATTVQISTAGLSEEDAIQAVMDGLTNIADDMAEMVPGLIDVTLAGEGASAALVRLGQDLGAVNTSFRAIGRALFDISIDGAAAASQIAQAFGGAEGYEQTFGAFFQAFYTDTEQQTALVAELQLQFAALGLSMPQSRLAFRELIENLNTTTEAGRELYVEVLSLAEAMDQALPTVVAFTDAIAMLVTDISGDIDSMIQTAETAARESAQAASLWYETAQTLREFLQDLTGSDLGGKNAAAQFVVREAAYQSALVAAKGGDATAAGEFPDLARDFLDSALAVSGSRLEYQRAVGRVQNDAQLLAGIATLEGAQEDVLQDLYEQQIEVLTSLANFLTYEGLTDEQIAELDESLAAFVEDWDGTIAMFDQALADLTASIDLVSSVSYDALTRDIGVVLEVLATDDSLDDETKALLAGAVDGITVTLDMVLREELPPDVLFLAANTLHNSLVTVEMLLDSTDFTADEMAFILAASTEVVASVQVVIGNETDPDALAIALAGTSELSRVLNLYLADDVSDDLLALALTAVHDYAVAIQAALVVDTDPEIRALIYEDAKNLALVVEAALSLTEDEAKILLGSSNVYAVNVTATVTYDALSAEEQALILGANTDALLTVAVTLLYPEEFTPEELALLQQSATDMLATISVAVNTAGLSPEELLFFYDLGTDSDVLIRTIEASMTQDMTDVELAVLDALLMGDASVLSDITVDVATSASRLDQQVLDIIEAGDAVVIAMIEAGVDLTAGELEQIVLGVIDVGGETVLVTISATMITNATALDQQVLDILEAGALIVTTTINADVAAVLSGYDEAIVAILDGGSTTATGIINATVITDATGLEQAVITILDFGSAAASAIIEVDVATTADALDQVVIDLLDSGALVIGSTLSIGVTTGINALGQDVVTILSDGGATVSAVLATSVTTSIDALGQEVIEIYANGGGIVTATVAGDITLGASALEQDLIAIVDAGGAAVSATIAGDITLGATGLEQDFIAIIDAGGGTIATVIAGDITLGATGLEQDFIAALTDFSDVTTRTLQGLIDTGELSDQDEAFLLAITGAAGNTITLAGNVQLDVSTSFESWYETTTTDLITDPMALLSESLSALSLEIRAMADAVELQNLNTALATAYAQQEAALISAQAVVNETVALEAATGVTLWDDDKNKKATLNVDAELQKLNYNADSAAYTPGVSDIDTFSDQFWIEGGLEDQIVAWRSTLASNLTGLDALRSQITALGGIPAFELGGYHSGGLAMVGERGPEVVDMSAGRVYSNSTTMGGFAAIAAELAAIKEELANQREENRQLQLAVVSNTRKTASDVRQMVKDGVPVRTLPGDTVATV